MRWKRMPLYQGTPFFQLFSQIIKQVEYPTVVKNIKANGVPMRFLFKWESEDCCRVDVFKRLQQCSE